MTKFIRNSSGTLFGSREPSAEAGRDGGISDDEAIAAEVDQSRKECGLRRVCSNRRDSTTASRVLSSSRLEIVCLGGYNMGFIFVPKQGC